MPPKDSGRRRFDDAAAATATKPPVSVIAVKITS